VQGKFINDLQLGDFLLSDNGQRQSLNQEFRNQPISLVVAVEANRTMQPVKQHIGRIASVIDTLIMGQGGEAAVVAFDDSVRTIEVFTADGEKLRRALQEIDCRRDKSRLVDAVIHCVDLLKTRQANRRRVVLLFCDRRDDGSEAKLREAVVQAELNNVIIYSLDVARLHAWAAAMASPHPDREGLDIKNSISQIYRGVRTLAGTNPVGVLTGYSGGREYSFYKLSALEQALTLVGEELHGQYLLSYTPANPTPGYHEIQVRVNRTGAAVRSRPGYWLLEPPE
jgi:VWFA-related protein